MNINSIKNLLNGQEKVKSHEKIIQMNNTTYKK